MILLFVLLFVSCLPSASANITEGLAGWWKMDETSGSTVVDSSVYGQTATANGTGIVTGCAREHCRSFNGTTDYVVIGNLPNLYFPGTFSVSVWIKRTGSLAASWGGYVIADYAASGNLASLALRIGGGLGGAENRAFFFWENPVGTYPQVIAGTVCGLNQWYHLVGVWDGTNRIIYVNGVAENSNNTVQARADNGGNMTLGRAGDLSGAEFMFPGQIDDVRLYHRALTAQEVLDLYRVGVSIKGASLNNIRLGQ